VIQMKMTVIKVGEKNVASIINMDDFIKMLERMKEKGYTNVVHCPNLGALEVSPDDRFYNIGFGLPSDVFKQKEPDLDIVIRDGHSACMLIMVKDELSKNLDMLSE
jgi:hypothetical protein